MGHRAAHQVRLLSDVQAHVISRRLAPIDVLYSDEVDPAARLDHEPVATSSIGRGSLQFREKGHQLPADRGGLALGDVLARVRKRRLEPFRAERFEQVVERVDFEGLERVLIVAAPPTSEPGSLGFSYVDVERRSGTLATVFADRVNALAAIAGGHLVDSGGQLLGRAMAHEIGHLLLGTTHHADRGLMRGRWTTIDLRKNQPWDWALSREEADLMRRAIAVRQRHPEQPAAIVARK